MGDSNSNTRRENVFILMQCKINEPKIYFLEIRFAKKLQFLLSEAKNCTKPSPTLSPCEFIFDGKLHDMKFK